MSSGGEYWRDAVPGGFEDRLLSGQDGLDRLSGASRFAAAPVDVFQARLSGVQLDHVRLELFAAGAHRAVRDTARIEADPVELVSFVQVQQGVLHVEAGGTAFDLHPGQAAIVDSREPSTWTAAEDVRMLRAIVGLEHIPAHLRRGAQAVRGPLPPTPLIEGFVAFAASVLRSASSGAPMGGFVVRALADLQSAVLAEARHPARTPTGAAVMRHRIDAYIDGHLTDPDLSPPTIAAALGVSVRHVHAVFNEGERTIARSVRDRRIAAIALELRGAGGAAPLDELAERYAFPTTEAMARAFRERFGRSPTAYRAAADRPVEPS